MPPAPDRPTSTTESPPPVPFGRVFPWLFAACCGFGVVPIWLTTYPPMVDLPQHAAQVATWHRWGQGGFPYSDYLFTNWLTPYLVANTLAYLLSSILSVLTAFKVVVSLAVMGLPLATLALLRTSGGSAWWALLAIPIGYGFAFHMGFVAFLFATPLALLSVVSGWRHAQRPTRRSAWIVFGLLQFLFFCHVLAFGWAGLVGAGLAAVRSSGWRDLLRRWIPYLAAIVMPAAWVVTMLWVDSSTRGGLHGFPIASRIPELGPLLVGSLGSQALLGYFGFFILLAPFLFGCRPSRDTSRWVPFGISLLLYLLLPGGLFGTALLHPRFAVLLVPTLLFALDRPRRGGLEKIGAVLLVLVALGASYHRVTVFREYEHETGKLAQMIEGMPEDARVLYLALDRASDHVQYPVYLHSGVWYQVEKGGLVDFSFAEYFPNRYRYLPDRSPQLKAASWQPWALNWRQHGGDYDFVLVRGDAETTEKFFRRLQAPLTPVARAPGGWWLWGRSDRLAE